MLGLSSWTVGACVGTNFLGCRVFALGAMGLEGDLPNQGSPFWSGASGRSELLLACGRVFWVDNGV